MEGEEGEDSGQEFRQEKRREGGPRRGRKKKPPKPQGPPRPEEPQPQGPFFLEPQPGPVRCPLCQADVSALDAPRRHQHVHRCLEGAESPGPAAPPECPLCGRVFRSVQGRKSHLKTCAAKLGVPPALLLQAVRRQQQQEEAQPSSSSSSSSSCPPCQSLPSAPRLKRKMFSSVENLAKKPKTAAKVEGADEDLQVAMAMSRSLFEREKAAAKQLSRGRRHRARPPSSPPPLLLQDPQKTRRDTEERLAQMLLEVGELPSTPPLPPSHLLETKQPEGRPGGSLWESSALTGPCFPESFLAPGLALPPLSQLPGTQGTAEPTSLPVLGPVGLQETGHEPSEAGPCQGRDDGGLGGPWERQTLGESGQGARLAQSLVGLAEDGTASSQELEEASGQDQEEEEEMRSSSSSQESREAPSRSLHRLALLGSLVDAFGRMLDSPHLSDIQFRVGGGEVLRAHRFVLYARCPLLLEECEAGRVGIALADGGGTLACPLLMSDFSREAVGTFLNFLYTADPVVPPHLRPDVAILANRFAVEDLAALCREDPLEAPKEGQAGDGGCGGGHGKAFDELLESWWLDMDSEARPEGAPAEAAAAPPPSPENMSQEELEDIYGFFASQRQAGEDPAQEEGGVQDDGWRGGQGERVGTGGASSRDRPEDPLEEKGVSRGGASGPLAFGGKGEPSGPLAVEEEEGHLEAEEEEELFQALLEAPVEGPCSDAEGGGHTQEGPRASSGPLALEPPNFPLGQELLPRTRSPALGNLPSAPQTPGPFTSPPTPPAALALLPGLPRPTSPRWGADSQSRAVPTSSPVQSPSGAAETLPPYCGTAVVLVLDSEEEEGPEEGWDPRPGRVSLGLLSLDPPSQKGGERQGAGRPLGHCRGSPPLGLGSCGAEGPSWGRELTLVPDTPLPLGRGPCSPPVGWRWPGSPGSGAGPPPCSPSPPGKAPLPPSCGPPGRGSPSSSPQEAGMEVVVLEDSEEEEEEEAGDPPWAAWRGEEEEEGGSPGAPWSPPGCPVEGADSSEDELPGGEGEGDADGQSSSSSSSRPDRFLPPSQRGFKATPPQKPLGGACVARETLRTADPQTPMPSFSTMVTPELRKELKRFGVRALPKQQMVLKLKEIFQFTHEQEGEAAPPSLQAQRAPAAGTRPKLATDSIRPPSHGPRMGSLGDLSSRGDSRPGLGPLQGGPKAAGVPLRSSPEKAPVSLVVPRGPDGPVAWQRSSSALGQALGPAEEPECPPPASQSRRGHREADPLEAVRHHLRSSPALCQRVLQFQPIELSALQADLKANGVSIALSRLPELLDALCVTFTTAESRREKRSPRKRRGGRRF